jgi:hypothetical protein
MVSLDILEIPCFHLRMKITMENFLKRVNKTESCWEWAGALNSYGYGIIRKSLRQGTHLVHRLSWELHRGPIPKAKTPRGTIVGRTCANKICVNPEHLVLGTVFDNHRYDRSVTELERFWSYVKKTESCWEWTGPVNQYGYGRLNSNKAHKLAHRFAWEITHGPVPDVDIGRGLFVCHHCDNRKCVNPDHLFLGTIQDNNYDRVAKGRWVSGEESGMSKLTNNDIRKIRKMRSRGLSQQKIADAFGVNQTNVSSILLGKTWAHVK